jgi:hypothetical protein
MGHWELSVGKSDDYYTPKYVFDALECGPFDLDVAAAQDPAKACVVAKKYISTAGLEVDWMGFIWCNPPYGKRGSKMGWVNKAANHGSGLMLVPDRTSADWWQVAAKRCVDFLTTYEKIQFIGTIYTGCRCQKGTTRVDYIDGALHCQKCGVAVTGQTLGPNTQPGTGNTLFAFGNRALDAIRTAESNNLGMTHRGIPTIILIGVSPSWSSVVEIVLGRVDRLASVKEIYDLVERLAPDKCEHNGHWKEKVRQKLQEVGTRISKGIYSIA